MLGWMSDGCYDGEEKIGKVSLTRKIKVTSIYTDIPGKVAVVFIYSVQNAAVSDQSILCSVVSGLELLQDRLIK